MFKVIFFGYTWGGCEPDAYQRALMGAFEKQGAEVHLIDSSYLAANVLVGIHPAIKEAKLIEYIQQVDPTLVISMNFGGLSRAVRDAIRAPVVTWLVDELTHLFRPDGDDGYAGAISAKNPLVISSFDILELFRGMYPDKAEHIHFIPSATDYESFRKIQLPKDYNISFVGSYLDMSDAEVLLSTKSPALVSGFSEAMRRLQRDYRHDFEQTVQELGLAPFLEKHGFDVLKFKRILSNVISSRDRLVAIEKVSDLGFYLFGNPQWALPLMMRSENALSCYQAGNEVRSHQQLVNVYQRSKISINVAQVQIGPALPYRVFDVMASDSLLMQPYHPQSDAFAIFGSDCPLPMYKNFDHLRELCQYYLKHEDERLEKVRLCNEKISKGFSFEDRVGALLRLVGKSLPTSVSQPRIIDVPMATFARMPLADWKPKVRDSLVWMIHKTFSPSQRAKCARLFV